MTHGRQKGTFVALVIHLLSKFLLDALEVQRIVKIACQLAHKDTITDYSHEPVTKNRGFHQLCGETKILWEAVGGDEGYLLELLRYIHRNPLEAGIVEKLNKYTWSSHRGYLSDAKKWDWLHKKFILSLFSKIKAESIRGYQRFVSKETPEEINQILARKKLPTTIGSKHFVDKIKEMFFSNKIHEEISESKFLAPDVNKIVE